MRKIISISSIQNDTLKSWAKLHQKKYRDQSKTFLIEGKHGVEEAIKYDHCQAIWTIDPEMIPFDGLIHVSPQHVINKLSTQKSDIDIVGLCTVPTLPIHQTDRVFLCDDIQDPGNLGTIIRSALAFGFDGIYLSKNTVDYTNEKVVRATQGAIFQIPIQVVDLVQTIQQLKENQVVTIGLSVDQTLIDDCPVSNKMAFVLGNEGRGIDASILEACDVKMTIPITNIESLNVAVCAGIIGYRFAKVT